MKLLVNDNELNLGLSLLDELKSNDKTVIHNGQGPSVGNARGEAINPLTREMVAIDAASGINQKDVAALHDITQATVSDSENGKVGDRVDEDLKAKVTATRFKIQDIAVAKLMDTLNLVDPTEIEKPKDRVAAAAQLANIVDKLTPKTDGGQGNVHLHFYGPRQKKEEQYSVIDV